MLHAKISLKMFALCMIFVSTAHATNDDIANDYITHRVQHAIASRLRELSCYGMYGGYKAQAPIHSAAFGHFQHQLAACMNVKACNQPNIQFSIDEALRGSVSTFHIDAGFDIQQLNTTGHFMQRFSCIPYFNATMRVHLIPHVFLRFNFYQAQERLIDFIIGYNVLVFDKKLEIEAIVTPKITSHIFLTPSQNRVVGNKLHMIRSVRCSLWLSDTFVLQFGYVFNNV